MSKEKMAELCKPLPEKAIQRTTKEQTNKPYDTDGYAYQYAVDRFNDVLATEWGYDWSVLHTIEGEYQSGTQFFDITVEVGIWVLDKENVRSHAGSHRAVLYGDALKGGITNAFKKTAAMWGVGRDAYAGLLDDDNKPLPDVVDNVKSSQKQEREPMRVCPECGVQAVIKSNPKYGTGWVCWKKKGGCGAKFPDGHFGEETKSKEDAERFFQSCPPAVQKFWVNNDYSDRKKFDFCKEHKWNEQAIIDFVQSQSVKDSFAGEEVFGDENVPG